MDQKQIGYFYLYKRCLIGEIHHSETAPVFDGHYQFWTTEAPKLFSTSEIQTVLMASYGCDRGRITFYENKYRLLGTGGIIKNKDVIVKLFGFADTSPFIIISQDNHYKIMQQDKDTLKDYSRYFKIPTDYNYLIGKI